MGCRHLHRDVVGGVMTWQEDALTKRNGHVAAGLTEAPTFEEMMARIKMQANIARGRVGNGYMGRGTFVGPRSAGYERRQK